MHPIPASLRILGILLTASGAFQFALAAQTALRPNVLFLIADDVGWSDIGFNGSKDVKTPYLDQLAREGVILDRHYVAPTCSPTRAGLLGGRYPSRFGVLTPTNNRVFLPETVTLASALQARGYFTAITGKWHLGSRPEWGPLQSGFEASHGSLAGGVDQYGHWYKEGPYRQTWHRNDQFIEEEGHATDLFMNETVGWIEANRQRPWFIQVAFTAAHIPLQEPREWLRLYDREINEPSRKLFAASVTHMDHAIGEIVKALERTGQRERTLIVFTSDNGGQRDWFGTDEYDGGHLPSPVLGNNEPLRGWKGDLYEGGIRVPALANWPGRLEPASIPAPVHIVDWFPTLARLAGYETTEDLKLDGRDIWPVLTGNELTPAPRTLYWRTNRAVALRQGDWKLIVHAATGKAELFNLEKDPNEQTDLAGREPQRVAELQALLDEIQREDRN